MVGPPLEPLYRIIWLDAMFYKVKEEGKVDQKPFMADLKPIYRAVGKEAGEHQLLQLEEKLGKKYPVVLDLAPELV